MTALAALLAERIAQSGPITLADYMAECLMHPVLGYYASRDPFGIEGDFITAPEISQMFGEVIGLGLAQTWLDQGCPAPFTLAELGPGRGTLLLDALRATRTIPGFHAAMSIHLVETSALLRARQQVALQEYGVEWHASTATLPDAPLFLVANEFFDALPVRQFQRSDSGWHERLVGLLNGALIPGLSPPLAPNTLPHRLQDTIPGDIVEICPAATAIIADLAPRIARFGGAAILIDYGHWRSKGDTFQAVQGHRPVDPFAEPGLADLTAHVDFEALAQAATQAAPTVRYSRMIPQGTLLHRLGIAHRAEALAQKLTGVALASHRAAYRRLTDPAEMGNLFQAMALYPEGAPPPGFDP